MTIFQEIQAGTIPARVSVADVYALTAAGVFSENDRFELIDGEIVPMAAAKADWHSIWQSRLTRALVRALPDDVRLYTDVSVTFADDVLFEPDLAVWRKGGLPTKVRGPDLMLVIEVSDSSIGYDLRVKAPRYAGFNVRDYWVVDAVRQTIRVHRAPIDGRYTDVNEYCVDQTVTPLLFPGITIRLADLD